MPDLFLLDYPGASRAAIAGLQEMFCHGARLHKREGLPEITLTTGRLPGAAPDAVILPPAFDSDAYLTPPPALAGWLRGLPDSCLIASACAGAFLLGAAGLLDGRSVTTHWALEADLQARFPKARVNADAILIRDGHVITAGGLLSWIDLALELIAHFSGPAIMREVGRHFVTDTGRREQRPYRGFSPPMHHGDRPIEQAQSLIARTFTAPISIAGLAQAVALSERTFLRRFERATGLTPLAYVQKLRIEAARRALESTTAPIDQIALSIGYENAGAFRKLFKRHTGLSPSQYRQRLKR